jgi:hypothetical protein
MCDGCGYAMDRATCTSDPTVTEAKDGESVSICMNCGKVYDRVGGKWVAMTAEAFADLPPETRAEITKHQRIRAEVIKTDLTARDKRA